MDGGALPLPGPQFPVNREVVSGTRIPGVFPALCVCVGGRYGHLRKSHDICVWAQGQYLGWRVRAGDSPACPSVPQRAAWRTAWSPVGAASS